MKSTGLKCFIIFLVGMHTAFAYCNVSLNEYIGSFGLHGPSGVIDQLTFLVKVGEVDKDSSVPNFSAWIGPELEFRNEFKSGDAYRAPLIQKSEDFKFSELLIMKSSSPIATSVKVAIGYTNYFLRSSSLKDRFFLELSPGISFPIFSLSGLELQHQKVASLGLGLSIRTRLNYSQSSAELLGDRAASQSLNPFINFSVQF